jgi:hypothetical protein
MKQSVLPKTTSATFVLRFWRETTAGKIRWRGSIKHIQSGEEIAFLQIETMLNFLNRYGIWVGGCDPITPKETIDTGKV